MRRLILLAFIVSGLCLLPTNRSAGETPASKPASYSLIENGQTVIKYSVVWAYQEIAQ